MFDKESFSEILKKIYNTYNNQRDFANATGVNRGYLSQYMNLKLNSPPKPNILKKIADSSKGITNYDELMEICGYKQMIYEYELLINGDLKYLDILFEGKDFKNTKDIIIELEHLKTGLHEYVENCYSLLDHFLEESETTRIINQDTIQRYRTDIKTTQEKINGVQKIIDKLKENSKK